jgi:hypothetical protein
MRKELSRRRIVIIAIALLLAAVAAAFMLLTQKPQPKDGPAPPDSLQTLLNSDTTAFRNDISMVIHQSAVNNLLAAIGGLSGDGSLFAKTSLTKYKWFVQNPRVSFCDTGAVFLADVRVMGFGTDYESQAVGFAHLDYDQSQEEIDLSLDQVMVELKVKLLGRELRLSRIDVASLYGSKIKLIGPLPLQTDFTVKKHKERMYINFSIVDHRVRYSNEYATIDFQVEFKESATKDRESVDPIQEKQTKILE